MYRAPLQEFRFVLHQLLDSGRLAVLPRYSDYSTELADSILEEAGRYGEQVLEPTNVVGDREGASCTPDGQVHLPASFRAAYEQFVSGGWPLLAVDTAQGGQGLPLMVATAAEEIWFGCNVAFTLCPQLGRGAAEALQVAGSGMLRTRYLPKLVSGEWTGTMNLTEPQAGSDLGAIRTRAVPDGGQYRLFGQKIFITYGEHDLAENILHLVLARIEGSPAGVKGISLFLVPKFLADDSGKPGARNDVRCVSIEHKLGIHGSPTCVMSYGDRDGAIGFLVGEANHGLEYMFIMMNAARLAVGVQGVGLGERAWQQADAWANERIQGRPLGQSGEQRLPIARHPDVRRMLLTLKSATEAMRAVALYAALQFDLARAEAGEQSRAAALARGELLIPIVKAWSTEQSVELASLAIQVHGGMGYIEETGAAQTLRDARITSIYEGTTGIQANDLVGRKLARDRGASMLALLADAGAELEGELGGEAKADPLLQGVLEAALKALGEMKSATGALLQSGSAGAAAASAHAAGAGAAATLAVAVPYLMLCGHALGGWLMARAACLATRRLEVDPANATFYRSRRESARFYAIHRLAEVHALHAVVTQGAASILEAEVAV